jgi:VWFA-related protein
MRRTLLTLVVLVAAMADVFAVQRGGGSAPQAPSPQNRPVFRATTRYVSVDVVVTDGHDKPVVGLTKDDFAISENGVAQTIVDFDAVNIPVGKEPVDLDKPTPPPSDVATNGSVLDSRAFVFVIDDSTLRPEMLVSVKRAMAQFLGTLASDDLVAMTYVSRSDLGHDFTHDFARLIDVVNLRRNAFGLNLNGGDRNRTFTLRSVIAALANSRHSRRAIIWVGTTACNPNPMGSPAEKECIDIITQARQADVPIYTLNPSPFTDANSINGIGTITSPDDAAAASAAIIADREAMYSLSGATGGRSFGGSDTPAAINALMTDNSFYYVLGYSPHPVMDDGKFHDIKVTVKRAGLHVRARPGYLAGSATPPAASTPKLAMTAALGAGIDDPSLPIRAFVAPLAASPRGTRTLVSVEVRYPRPDDANRTLNDELRVGVLALTSDGKIKASFQRPFTFTGTWREHATANGAFVMNEIVDLPHEKLALRIGVTSQALGKTGTANIYVTAPDFTDNKLQLSGIVLGATSNAIDVSTGLDLLRTVLPFQPTMSRTFTASQTLRVFCRSSWGSKDTAVDVTMAVTGSGQPREQQFRLESAAPDRTGHRAAVLDRELKLADFAPGHYVLTIDAHLTKGQPERRAVPFEVR